MITVKYSKYYEDGSLKIQDIREFNNRTEADEWILRETNFEARYGIRVVVDDIAER